MNERKAIARLKRGDINGLESVVRTYQVRAVRAAALITRDRALAEDLVQTAFIRAYERIDQFDASRPFGPWFLRSVVNDAVKAVTRGKTHTSLDDSLLQATLLADPLPGPEELLERAETQEAVWEALGQLSLEQRAVIVLRYYLGLSDTEIAEAQACAPGTVKWRLHAARSRLRGLLMPWRFAALAPDSRRPTPSSTTPPHHSQGESL